MNPFGARPDGFIFYDKVLFAGSLPDVAFLNLSSECRQHAQSGHVSGWGCIHESRLIIISENIDILNACRFSLNSWRFSLNSPGFLLNKGKQAARKNMILFIVMKTFFIHRRPSLFIMGNEKV